MAAKVVDSTASGTAALRCRDRWHLVGTKAGEAEGGLTPSNQGRKVFLDPVVRPASDQNSTRPVPCARARRVLFDPTSESQLSFECEGCVDALFLSSAVCKLHHTTRRTDNNDNHTLRGSSLISEEDGARVVIHAAGQEASLLRGLGLEVVHLAGDRRLELVDLGEARGSSELGHARVSKGHARRQ